MVEARIEPISEGKAPIGNEYKSKNVAGLTANVSDLSPTPNEVLEKTLIPGETVLREFDCLFPSHFIPRWKIVALLVGTLGLYAIVLAWRALERWCYRKRCCTPAYVDFLRGKKKTEKDCLSKWCGCCFASCIACCCRELCAAPVEYEVEMLTRVYKSTNIRQISQYFSSKALCCSWMAEEGLGCCCLDYECGLVVSFDEFDHNATDYNGQYNITTSPSPWYIHLIKATLGSAVSAAESLAHISTNDRLLYVCSSTEDLIFNGDVHNVVETLSGLHKRLVEVLPEFPDIFVPNPDLEVGKTKEKLSFIDNIVGLRVVYDSGEINVPAKWFPLMSGEEIVAVTGQVFHMTWWDWYHSIASLGYYYCTEIRRRKFARSAIILTNKRIVEMTLYQRAGEIPANLNNFDMRLTSYLPGEIKSGIFISEGAIQRGMVLDRVQNLRATVNTAGGALEIFFYNGVDALDFAKAMTMTPKRDLITRKICVDWPDKLVGDTPDATDLKYLPLMYEEKVRGNLRCTFRGAGISNFQPFCSGKIPTTIWNEIRSELCYLGPTPNVFSKESCGFCFPWLPYFGTCFLRPFIKSERIIITDSAFLYYTPTRNYGLCGFKPVESLHCPTGPFARMADFTVAWVPISDMYGYNSRISASGKENCYRRAFQGCICGKLCCPTSNANYELKIDLGSFDYTMAGRARNHNFFRDEFVNDALSLLNHMETSIMSDQFRQKFTAATNELAAKATRSIQIATEVVPLDGDDKMLR